MCVGLFMCFGMSDAYCEYRDGCGRFTVGNPGRTSYSWLSGREFAERYPFLRIEKPGVCLSCGCDEYRFDIRWDDVKMYSIRCKCNNCNSVKYYRAYSGSWGNI